MQKMSESSMRNANGGSTKYYCPVCKKTYKVYELITKLALVFNHQGHGYYKV